MLNLEYSDGNTIQGVQVKVRRGLMRREAGLELKVVILLTA